MFPICTTRIADERRDRKGREGRKVKGRIGTEGKGGREERGACKGARWKEHPDVNNHLARQPGVVASSWASRRPRVTGATGRERHRHTTAPSLSKDTNER